MGILIIYLFVGYFVTAFICWEIYTERSLYQLVPSDIFVVVTLFILWVIFSPLIPIYIMFEFLRIKIKNAKN